KCLPVININLERLLRIRAVPTVSNPVGADVIWIEAPQIGGDEDVIVASARRICIDCHALSRASGIGERISIVTVRILIIIIYRARRTRGTSLRNIAPEEAIGLR